MGFKIHKVLGYGAIHPNAEELFEFLDESGMNGEVDRLITEYMEKINESVVTICFWKLKIWQPNVICHIQNDFLNVSNIPNMKYPRKDM